MERTSDAVPLRTQADLLSIGRSSLYYQPVSPPEDEVAIKHCIDITYIRLRNSWLYLVAILDWFSCYVISWSLAETLELAFVLDAIAQARAIALSIIWNTDQGSHFTSPQVTQPLLDAGIQISMDGQGRATDNIFTERFWRSLKYEEMISPIMAARVRHGWELRAI